MDIIEAMEIKIFNFVKEWIEVRQRNNEPGQFYKVKTVHTVPFSNIITINKGTQSEVARTYKSFPDTHFQKMLKTHKDYYVEAFKQEHRTVYYKNGMKPLPIYA